MSSFAVWLPLPRNRANARGHSRIDGYYKRRYYLHCAPRLMEFKAVLKDAGVVVPIVQSKWKAHFVVARRYDADNLAALCKWPLDALVSSGILEDDGPEYCWPLCWPTQQVSKKGLDRGVTLWIYPEGFDEPSHL